MVLMRFLLGLGVASPALAQGGGGDGPERVVFSFDDGLAGWVLGGKAPTYSAHRQDPGSWKDGGGAAEIRYEAGEKVLFGTDCLNQGPPPGLLQRIFGGSSTPRAPLVDVSSMAGFAFEVWSEASTMLFLNVAERSGARYVHPFEVRAGEWQHVRVPLTSFTLAGDSSDDDGKLDGDQVYAFALGDLRSFTSGDSPANRVRIDSLAVWDAERATRGRPDLAATPRPARSAAASGSGCAARAARRWRARASASTSSARPRRARPARSRSRGPTRRAARWCRPRRRRKRRVAPASTASPAGSAAPTERSPRRAWTPSRWCRSSALAAGSARASSRISRASSAPARTRRSRAPPASPGTGRSCRGKGSSGPVARTAGTTPTG
ncbi:MAG: CIA30 family protein [Deltaproteobacteria bacterium]|nr:CIA30 family protein [Deltaproteobacteria bacterium]